MFRNFGRSSARRVNRKTARKLWGKGATIRRSRLTGMEQMEDRRVLAVFSSAAAITINDNAAATPYPSTLAVALPTGVTASVVDVNATLSNFTHSFPDDVDVLLVGPAGQASILISDVGGVAAVSNITLTLDDSAASALAADGPMASGTYQPTDDDNGASSNDGVNESFTADANLPAAPHGASLAVFNGTNPNGTWRLFVEDDAGGDSGSIAGWSLDIQLGGAVTIDAGAAADDTVADTFKVETVGANTRVTVNNVIVFDEPSAGITSLALNGSSDVDTFDIDSTSASFPITVNGGGENDTFNVTASSVLGTLNLNGQDGDDTFNISGVPTASNIHIDGGDETPDGDGDVINMNSYTVDTVRHFFDSASSGRFEYDGDATDNGGATEVQIDYTGLEPITDNGDVTNRVFTFTTSGITGSLTSVDTTHTRIASGASEAVDFTTPSATLNINLASGAANTLNVTGLADDWDTPTSDINLGANGDTVNFEATGNTGATWDVNGGAGDDTVNLAPVGKNLDALFSDIEFLGGGGTADALNIFDQNDIFGDSFTITSTTLDRSFWGGATYDAAVEVVVLNAGNGFNTFNINSTSATATTTVNGDGGDDTFNIAAASLGASTLNVNGDDGDDTFNINGVPTTGSDLNIDGGDETPDGDGDVINMNSYTVDTVRHFLVTSSTGSIEYDGDTTDNGGLPEVVVDYVGLEPIFDNGNVANRVFDFGGGNDTDVAILDNGNLADNITRIQAPLNAESVDFTTPTATLTVNLGDGNDVISIDDFDSLFNTPVTNINGQNNIDEIRVGRVFTGLTMNVDTGVGFPGDRTVVGLVAGTTAVSFAQFNTGVGLLTAINGILNIGDTGGLGETYLDDSGHLVGETYTVDPLAVVPTFGGIGLTVDLASTPGTINVSRLMSLFQLAAGSGDDTINVNATTDNSTTTATFFGNDGDDTFNIDASNLSAASNIFQGDANDDTFNVITSTAAGVNAPILIQGEANDFGGGVGSRDVVNINEDYGLGVVNLTVTYTGNVGDSEVTVAGLGSVVTIDTAETVRYDGILGNTLNDTVTVVGTLAGTDLLTVAPITGNRALVFNNSPTDASGPFNGPPEVWTDRIPGVSGGSTRPDLDLTLDTTGLTITDTTAAADDRLYIYGQSTAGLNDGNTFDPFGFGAGYILPQVAEPTSYDDINVSDTLTTIDALVHVNYNSTDFQQAVPNVDPAIVINAGYEGNPPSTPGTDVADEISLTLSPTYKFQINGGDPDPATTGIVPPDGDRLNVLTVVPVINVYSNKNPGGAPVVTIEFPGSGFQPFSFSSIENFGTYHATTVNLIGDNNDVTVDQNDNFVVEGTGPNAFNLFINGSIAIPFADVQFLNVYGFDQQPASGGQDNPANPGGVSPAGQDINVDTLELTPYADNADVGGHPPRGWGINVFFNEGVPGPGEDGFQEDLIIYHTSHSLGGGGSVSENIVIQPSGPDNGEIRATNAADGSVIVVLQFTANTDIIVVDDDGSVTDTDTLTLRGTNPDTVQTSGNETFDVDFDAAGDVANPYVTVTDTSNGSILYRLRSFTDPGADPLDTGDDVAGPFATVNFELLGGTDVFNFRTPITGDFASGVKAVNVDGGLGDDQVVVNVDSRDLWHDGRLTYDGGQGSDSLVIRGSNIVITEVTYTPGPIPGSGRITHDDGAPGRPLQVIDFVNLEPVIDVTPATSLTVNGTNDNDVINYTSDPTDNSRGLVSVGTQETIAFNDKQTLVINAFTGNDLINLNNTSTPTNLGSIVVNANQGDDVITTQGGLVTPVTLNGDSGNDLLDASGSTGGATLNGNEGDDILRGGSGNDTMDGGAGDDVFVGNGGTDNVGGGAGASIGDIILLQGTSGDDTFSLSLDASGHLVATVNGVTTTYQNFVGGPISSSGIEHIVVQGLGGNDALTVNDTNGAISIPINFDGGNDADSLILTGGTATSDTYAPGPNPGQGTSTIVIGGVSQVVTFTNLEPVFDLVGGPLTVVASNADNAINYTTGKDSFANFLAHVTNANWGEVSIDFQEQIEFTNKTSLTINALAGNDVIQLNNANTPASLAAITVNGNDPTTGDSVIVNLFDDDATVATLTPNSAVVTFTGGSPTINVNTAESLTIAGDGSSNLTISGIGSFVHTPGATNDSGTVQNDANIPLHYTNLGVASTFTINGTGGADTLEVYGTSVSDIFTVDATTGDVTVNSRLPIIRTAIENLVLRGLDGDDTFNLNAVSPYTTTLVDGGDPSASDVLNLNGTVGAEAMVVNLATQTITGFGGTDSYVGVEHVNLTGNGGADTLTVNGTATDDSLTYTPTSANGGNFQLAGQNTTFTFDLGAAADTAFTVDLGAGFADQITVVGTNARDLIFIDAPNRRVTVNALNTNKFRPVNISANTESLTALGLDGNDTFQVVPPAAGGNIDNLLIHIDGGSPHASDALVIGNPDGGDAGTDPDPFGATDFVVVSKSLEPNAGVVRVYRSAAATPDIAYNDIEVVSPNFSDINPDTGNPNLLILGADMYEANEFRATAYYLGAGETLQIEHASIFPNSTEHPGVPADADYFRVVALDTGILDFQVYFRTYAAGLLPGNGNLDIAVLDSDGTVITGFGTNDTNDNERVRIPAVAGQTYYLRVTGATADVVNGYSATVINTAPPVPFDIELDDSPANGATNPPGQTDNSDTGRSQFDNITYDNTPTIFLRLDDAIFLHDLPGNAVNNSPPDEVIPIPFSAAGAAGYRVAIFVENPINGAEVFSGFATFVSEGVYSYTFPALSDGSHFITARVQMVDPASPTETGFGDRSASLEIIVDTVAPPVFLGDSAIANDGLHPASDSGVPGSGNQDTLDDNVTNVTVPTFWGRAEADSWIRVYLDMNGNGTVDVGTDLLIAQTTATPLDGTNQFPNGQWEARSTFNMNDPQIVAALGFDGLRKIMVTAEDVAGNLSPTTNGAVQVLDIFVDTQGPQITQVDVNSLNNSYNIWDHKATNNGTLVPTPLVNSLVISVKDLPDRTAVFNYLALNQGIAADPGHYTLVGDANGIIPIASIVVNLNPTVDGDPATGTITLNFASPLPDDRYTLTIDDDLVDPAGNNLDGESNADEPHEPSPLLPSGDGVTGGDFVARFTVDSRPELAVWAAGSVYTDTNGNFLFDPTNVDFTNRDITFGLGFTSDNVFAGNFVQSAAGMADGYDKIAAYGRVGGSYRWIIDTDSDGVPNFATTQVISPNGIPVAGNFDGNLANGDEVGLFTGTSWVLDLNHDFIAETVISTTLVGIPIVGDFNGDGIDDLATWSNDKFYIDFRTNFTSPSSADLTFDFGFIGTREQPFAADFDKDGIDDLGLWVPDRSGAVPTEQAEWYILVSNHLSITSRVTAAVGDPTRNVVYFTPTPFGHDIYAQFGDDYALPLVGNFDPPATPASQSAVGELAFKNPRKANDVNDDGHVTNLDAFLVISALRSGDAAALPRLAAGVLAGAPYVDTTGDNNLTNLDAFLVISDLRSTGGVGEGAAEGEVIVSTPAVTSTAAGSMPAMASSLTTSLAPSSSESTSSNLVVGLVNETPVTQSTTLSTQSPEYAAAVDSAMTQVMLPVAQARPADEYDVLALAVAEATAAEDTYDLLAADWLAPKLEDEE